MHKVVPPRCVLLAFLGICLLAACEKGKDPAELTKRQEELAEKLFETKSKAEAEAIEKEISELEQEIKKARQRSALKLHVREPFTFAVSGNRGEVKARFSGFFEEVFVTTDAYGHSLGPGKKTLVVVAVFKNLGPRTHYLSNAIDVSVDKGYVYDMGPIDFAEVEPGEEMSGFFWGEIPRDTLPVELRGVLGTKGTISREGTNFSLALGGNIPETSASEKTIPGKYVCRNGKGVLEIYQDQTYRFEGPESFGGRWELRKGWSGGLKLSLYTRPPGASGLPEIPKSGSFLGRIFFPHFGGYSKEAFFLKTEHSKDRLVRYPLTGAWDPGPRVFAWSGKTAQGKWIQEPYGFHLGEDLKRQAETPVYPMAPGKVMYADYQPGAGIGYGVVIEHAGPYSIGGQKCCTVYFHMRQPRAGEQLGKEINDVARPIGYVSGLPVDHANTWPHLHFGIRKGAYQAGVDQRTGYWFYPGYTTRRVRGVKENNAASPHHAAILSEWENPTAFLASRLATPARGQDEQPSKGAHAAPGTPSEEGIKNAFRAYFGEYNQGECLTKADLLEVSVQDVSVEATVTYVKLRLKVKWKGHNIGYAEGPLKRAPGQRGDTVSYCQIFRFGRGSEGWEIDGARGELPTMQGPPTTPSPKQAGYTRRAPESPSQATIKKVFRQYFSEDCEASIKAELLDVSVQDISVRGAIADVRLKLEIRWRGHNTNYTEGPLKGAPGQRGDTVSYSQAFKFRRWSKGWDIEGRTGLPLIE